MKVGDELYLKELSSTSTEWAVFTHLEKGITYVRYLDYRDEIGIEEAQIHTEKLKEVSSESPCKIIVNFTDTSITFSNEAREYFAKNVRHTKLRLSQALVINSLAHKLVANFYMRINKPNSPTKVFTDLSDALRWTLSLDLN